MSKKKVIQTAHKTKVYQLTQVDIIDKRKCNSCDLRPVCKSGNLPPVEKNGWACKDGGYWREISIIA